jgi:hypothetical protein
MKLVNGPFSSLKKRERDYQVVISLNATNFLKLHVVGTGKNGNILKKHWHWIELEVAIHWSQYIFQDLFMMQTTTSNTSVIITDQIRHETNWFHATTNLCFCKFD